MLPWRWGVSAGITQENVLKSHRFVSSVWITEGRQSYPPVCQMSCLNQTKLRVDALWLDLPPKAAIYKKGQMCSSNVASRTT